MVPGRAGATDALYGHTVTRKLQTATQEQFQGIFVNCQQFTNSQQITTPTPSHRHKSQQSSSIRARASMKGRIYPYGVTSPTRRHHATATSMPGIPAPTWKVRVNVAESSETDTHNGTAPNARHAFAPPERRARHSGLEETPETGPTG